MRHAIGHARLMRESTDRVQAVLHEGDAREQFIVRRVLESPTIWQQWESEHSMLMRQLAGSGVRRVQVMALRETSFRLLHATALFDHVRRAAVRGPALVRLIAHFRPGRSYESALIAEHGTYLRKACSYLCAEHLGREVIEDPAFLDPMPRYEELYREYFDLYCAALIGGEAAIAQRSLLPLLKKQLSDQRLAILDPRSAQLFLRREQELRRPTGDTARMPSLKPRPPSRPR